MAERPPAGREAPNCHRCRYFYITHEARWPYGCRWFEMKSRTLPSSEVERSSGAPCRAFQARPEAGGR
jgi:hypothetical protein